MQEIITVRNNELNLTRYSENILCGKGQMYDTNWIKDKKTQMNNFMA